MENTNLLDTKSTSPKKVTKNSKIFKSVINAILDKKGEDIVSLDLRKIPESVADFFIICTANNGPQIKAISENIEHVLEEVCEEKVYKKEGYQSLQWVLLDYVNIVVHVMNTSSRTFYKLEELWSDADATKHSN